MTKTQLEKEVAALYAALRRAVVAVNDERLTRRPKRDLYAEPLLGREDLLRIERKFALARYNGTCSAPAPTPDQDVSGPAVSQDGPAEVAARVRAT